MTKLNEIIHSVSKLNLSDFTTLSLIKEIIRVNPKLMLESGNARCINPLIF